MDFYRIDEKYNKYLQDYEKRHRGFTKVPNVCYSDRNKFSFGAVLEINGIKRANIARIELKKTEASLDSLIIPI